MRLNNITNIKLTDNSTQTPASKPLTPSFTSRNREAHGDQFESSKKSETKNSSKLPKWVTNPLMGLAALAATAGNADAVTFKVLTPKVDESAIEVSGGITGDPDRTYVGLDPITGNNSDGYLKFNRPANLDNNTLKSVTLTLQTDNLSADLNNIKLFGMQDGWNAATLDTATPSLDQLIGKGTVVNGDDVSFITFDITDYFKSQKNDGIVSLGITNAGGELVPFFKPQNSENDYTPYIAMEIDAIPEPNASALLAVGTAASALAAHATRRRNKKTQADAE